MKLRVAAAALALLAVGCSSVEDMRDGASRIEYKTATKLPPLDVPPDLTSPKRDGRYQLPEDASGATTLSGYEKGRAQQAREGARGPQGVLPAVDGVHVQRDGNTRWLVVDMPAAADGLVEYFRAISGEHPDWDEYRQAMADQGKSLIRVRPTRWGPIATGGFPPELFEDE